MIPPSPCSLKYYNSSYSSSELIFTCRSQCLYSTCCFTIYFKHCSHLGGRPITAPLDRPIFRAESISPTTVTGIMRQPFRFFLRSKIH